MPAGKGYKKKKKGFFEGVKSRLTEEMKLLKESPSAFANADAADKLVRQKRKRKRK